MRKKMLTVIALSMMGMAQAGFGPTRINARSAWVFGENKVYGQSDEPAVIAPTDASLANGESQEFVATVPDGGRILYWSHGSNGSGFNADVPGSFGVCVTNSVKVAGPDFKLTYKVDVNTPEQVFVGVVIDYYPFEIRFDRGQGGGAAMEPLTNMLYNQTVKLPANTYSRDGYAFLGWRPDTQSMAGGEEIVGDGETLKSVGERLGVKYETVVTLKAVWEANGYRVQFRDRDGAQLCADMNCVYDEKYDFPTPKDKPGYSFAGWSRTVDGSPVSNFTNLTKEPNGKVTLYAIWHGSVTGLNYDLQGGECPSKPSSAEFGQAAKLPAPMRSGYRFVGWVVSGDVAGSARWGISPRAENALKASQKIANGAKGEVYLLDLNPEQGKFVTLTAVWQGMEYLISYDFNGGLAATGGLYPVKAATDEEIMVSAPTLFGKEFDGWSMGGVNKGKGPFKNLSEQGSAVVLKATWKAPTVIRYTLKFQAGASVRTPGDMVCTNKVASALPFADQVDWPGHTLAGWATDKGRVTAPGGAFTGSLLDVREGGQYTLTAQWTTNAYRVVFFGNGGRSDQGEDVAEQAFVYGESKRLAMNAFNRTGYVFAGWAREPFAGTVDYGDGQEVQSLSAADGGQVRLFARWTPAGAGDGLSDAAKWIGCQLDLDDHGGAWERVEVGGTKCLKAVLDPGSNRVLSAVASCRGTVAFHLMAKIAPQSAESRNALRFAVNKNSKSWSADTNLVWSQSAEGGDSLRWSFECKTESPDDHVLIDRIDWTPLPDVGLTFRMGDGAVSPEDVWTNVTRASEKAVGELPQPVRGADWSFVGWQANSGEPGEAIDADWQVPVAEDNAVTAKWERAGVRIHFNKNDEAGREWALVAYKYGRTYEPPAEPTRVGYRFVGWFDAKGGGDELTAAKEFAPADDERTYYARWRTDGGEEPVAEGFVRVAFLMNDAEASESRWAETDFKIGETYSSGAWPMEVPHWQARAFLGWFTAAAGGDEVTAEMTASDAVKRLYAHWDAPGTDQEAQIEVDKRVAVVFYLNDGTKNAWATLYCETGTTLAADCPWPEDPTRPGWGFTGWWTSPEEDAGAVQVTRDSVIGQTAYYAQWNKAKIDISEATVTLTKEKWDYLDGEPVEPTVKSVVWHDEEEDRDVTLAPTDYVVSYEDNREEGKSARVVVTGKNAYTGAAWVSFEIAKNTAAYDMSGVEFPGAHFDWDGEGKSLNVTGSLPPGVKVSYVGNNQTNPGTYAVTAQFRGAEYRPAIKPMTAQLRIWPAALPPPSDLAPNEAMVGRHFRADLKSPLCGEEDNVFGKKTTVKAEVLPAGLKLVKTTGATWCAWRLEGVPTETWKGGEEQVAYVRITDEKKVSRLVPLTLKVLAAEPATSFCAMLPNGRAKVAYSNYYLASLWPDFAQHPKNWSVSGLPSGLKFATKRVTSKGKVVAEAYELYGTPAKAGRYAIKVTEKKVDGTSYSNVHRLLLTVLNADGSEPPAAKPVPGFKLEATELEGYEATGIGKLRQGVCCGFAITNSYGSTVSAKGLPTGVKLVASPIKEGKKTLTTVYSLAGVPTKTGLYVSVFTTKLNGVTVRHAVAFEVLALPAWAKGTFNGLVRRSAAEGKEIGLMDSVTMTVGSAGKISGKVKERGQTWTFSAKGYGRELDDGDLAVVVTAKVKKATCPLTLKVQYAGVEAVTNGARAVGFFGSGEAAGVVGLRRAFGKDKGAAAFAKRLAGLYNVRLNPGEDELAGWGGGYLALKVDKTGGVKASGKAADGTSLSCSATLGFDRELAVVPLSVFAAPSAYKGGMLAGDLAIGERAGDGQLVVESLSDGREDGLGLVWASDNPRSTGDEGVGFVRALSAQGALYRKTLSLTATYGSELSLAFAAPDKELNGKLVEPVALTNDQLVVTVDAKDAKYVALKATKPVKNAAGQWEYGGKNDSALTFTFTKSTGMFKGTFVAWYDDGSIHKSQKFSFAGLAVQDGGDWVGYYLVPRTGEYFDAKSRLKTYKWNESRSISISLPVGE